MLLASLAWKVYKDCKSASAEFLEIRNEVNSLHTAILELQDEAENHESILNRAGSGRKRELEMILNNCVEVLRELQQLVGKYRSLGTKHMRTWDRIKFGSEGIQQIRDKLMFHTSALTLFLTSLGTGSLGRIERKLDELALEIRKGQHEPSLITVCDEGNSSEQDNAWRLLMNELAEDFSKEEIESNKAEIKIYIHSLIGRGELNEEIPRKAGENQCESLDETIGQQSSISGETPFLRSTSSRSNLLPSSSVETDEDSFCPMVMRETDNTARVTTAKGLHSPLESGRINEVKESTDVKSSSSEDPPPSVRQVVDSIEDVFPPYRPREPPKKKMGYVGIDLNADYCQVAAFDEESQDSIILNNENGNSITPAFVAFTKNEILVGEVARDQALVDVENTFFNFTWLLGAFFEDEITGVIAKSSFCQIDNLNDRPALFVPCRQRHYSPEELTAFLIKKMVRTAEVNLQRTVSSVSLSSYSVSRVTGIEALHRAAMLANVDIAHSLRQSTLAAAMKYAHDCLRGSRGLHSNILVVNVRNDGCSCSLFQISERTIFPLGTLSRTYDKFSVDNHLAELLSSNFYANHGEITEEPSSRGKMRLLRSAEMARRRLMSSTKVKVFLGSFHGTSDLNVQLQQSQLKAIVDKYVLPVTIRCFERLCSSLRISKEDINNVICFGEIIVLPDVQDVILNQFSKNKIPKQVGHVDPVGYAALGNSLYYASASERDFNNRMSAIEVHYTNIALSIHTRDDREIMATVFRSGSSLPVREVIDIGIAKQNGEGALLQFYDMGEFKTEKRSVLFEIAVPFSMDISSYDRNRHWQLGIVSNQRSRLASITLSNEQSGTLIDIDRSPSGLLTIKSGCCVPITPQIRRNWLIMKYLSPERPVQGPSLAIVEAEPSLYSDRSAGRPSRRVSDTGDAALATSPPERASRRRSRSSRELREVAPPLSSPLDKRIRRRASRWTLNIDEAPLLQSSLPDRSFNRRSHSSRELREATPLPILTDKSVKRRSHSSRELREAVSPSIPLLDKYISRRSSRKVFDIGEEVPLKTPPDKSSKEPFRAWRARDT